ncbi:hypothetical protein BST10_19870 [Mycolicibacter algericus DSM 45454]|uniref:Uncharacterized protein n=1 Tax=Mycolicibacter algericus DSM 45454 TaxID=723879 RepID=A0ABX3RIN5_MYCAL|nr:hypothetical protein BST10_19870 [Mycolicibacter algericus DSM 45454]
MSGELGGGWVRRRRGCGGGVRVPAHGQQPNHPGSCVGPGFASPPPARGPAPVSLVEPPRR